MKTKRAVLWIVLLGVCVTYSTQSAGVDMNARQDQQSLGGAQRMTRPHDDPTTLHYFARKAQLEGLKQVDYPLSINLATKVKSLGEAVARYSIAIVTPVKQFSRLLPSYRGIDSIYRCKAVEILHLNEESKCCDNNHLVTRHQPPNARPNEMYLYTQGGRVVIDGVEVIQKDLIGDIKIGHKYIIFFEYGDRPDIAIIQLGYNGVFELDETGELFKDIPAGNPLKGDIGNKLHNSLSLFKTAIKSHVTPN